MTIPTGLVADPAEMGKIIKAVPKIVLPTHNIGLSVSVICVRPYVPNIGVALPMPRSCPSTSKKTKCVIKNC